MDKPESAGSDGKPGHPRSRGRDAEETRDAILDAGEIVFAEHGFDGARVDAIAEASGYNKSLIFQYFDDKLGLYAAVIRRADEDTRDMQNRAMLELMGKDRHLDLPRLQSILREYVGWYFDYLVGHPRILRIFNWEMAEGWQTFSKVATERDFQDVEEFAPIFQQLQDKGLMRAAPDALLQYTTALFAINAYLAIVPLYQTLEPGVDLNSPAAMRQGREFVIEFVMNGLLVEPGHNRPRKTTKKSGAGPSPRKKGRTRG